MVHSGQEQRDDARTCKPQEFEDDRKGNMADSTDNDSVKSATGEARTQREHRVRDDSVGKRSAGYVGGKSDTHTLHDEEPQRKRQAPSRSEESGESEKDISLDPGIGTKVEIKIELPDPNAKVSPDEFLLQLIEAQYGVSLEVKKALSMKDFFVQVTEEQMAAYNTEVVCAARTNNLDELKRLHANGQALNCFNRFGESLLNLACRRGFESIVEFLLEQPEIELRICDDGGRTPLHDACWHPSPQLKICKWIIERDPSLFLISDKRGFTAFQYARAEHWDIWRNFLFENRDCLKPLATPELLSRLSKESS